MYTCCPECRTWFRVTEAQLESARGWVRCGQCLESFDASSRLWSGPDEESAPMAWRADEDLADGIPEAEPESDAISRPRNEDLPENSLGPRSAPSSGDDPMLGPVSFGDADLDEDLDSEPPGPMVGDVRRVSPDDSRERPGSDRIHEGRVMTRRRRSREQAILDRIEGLDVRRGHRWATNSCIALLLLLVLQYTWFMAGDLASTFPILGSALDRFCAVTGCEANRRSAEEGIRVVSRTMRPHAEYASALSVEATLENRALEARAFPVVVFVLYGEDGGTVASRAFEPAEYLDGGTVPSEGLEPGGRVDIAFDLVAPSKVAVSFDLRLI